MLRRTFLLSTLAVVAVNAQTTYTGCHNHTTSGTAIEYCFGGDGQESALATYPPSTITDAPASASAATTSDAAVQTTAVTSCHVHETEIYCINGSGSEVLVEATLTASEPPAQYTDCHAHGAEQYCVDDQGNDVAVLAAGEEHGHAEGEGAEGADADAGESQEHCHEHAGVPHCTGGAGEEAAVDCGLRERDFNIGLRVGTIFVVLVTSTIGVFAPMVLNKLPLGSAGAAILLVIKQFGTGIIISTAFVHLYTHAELMFANECISLDYEGTTSAIVMAGIFLSFLVEYLGLRLVASRAAKSGGATGEDSAFQAQQVAAGQDKGTSSERSSENNNAFAAMDHHHTGGPNSKLSVLVMEAGILFHSILIGLTLVVSGDSFYRTLLVVIVFHQFFEGLALGARIAMLPGPIFPGKFIMAISFALITPIGMAIGIGVLNQFNGNDPSTVIAIGTLDAVSSGILIWVGVVAMWARDWVIEGGEMSNSKFGKTLGAGTALVLGIILMSILGKWA